MTGEPGDPAVPFLESYARVLVEQARQRGRTDAEIIERIGQERWDRLYQSQ